MNILGISCFYHDAAACLLQEGMIVAAAEEERFTRRKHDANLPINAIRYCLQEGGLRVEDLDYVAFYEKPFLKFQRILHTYLETFPRSLPAFFKAMRVWLGQKLWIRALIKGQLRYPGPIAFVEHHLSHAASCFLVSPFEEAAILTLDGVGEWTTATQGIGQGRAIQILKEIHFPHSLGLLYSAFTGHLGFEVNDGEYKVMGMAPYGKPTYYDQVRRMIDIKEDGSFALDMSYFAYHYKLETVSERFRQVFGPPRQAEAPPEQRYADMAASIQKVTEDVMVTVARHLRQSTEMANLCMAGGVAYNCVANGRVLREAGFDRLFIQPAAGDSGGAIGAAAYLHSVVQKERPAPMRHAYLGPSFSPEEMRRFLESHHIAFTEHSTEELLQLTARLIAANNVVGWFQGRMEFGPRALGSRSILANASNPAMKDIVNEKIKHREQFRPFAPSVLWDHTPEYFDIACESPFMLLVADVWPEKREVIPAITHIDGTARLQTVRREDNPLYYDLIQEYYRLTGVPVVLNTSFNVRGEPIVCTPEDAYNCFTHTDMDYMVMGNFLITAANKKRLREYPGRTRVKVEEVIV